MRIETKEKTTERDLVEGFVIMSTLKSAEAEYLCSTYWSCLSLRVDILMKSDFLRCLLMRGEVRVSGVNRDNNVSVSSEQCCDTLKQWNMSEEEDDTIVAVKETIELDIFTKNDHSDARRVASNNSVGSLEGNNQQHVSSRTSKKMSVTSTLSNTSSDQPYISMMSGDAVTMKLTIEVKYFWW